MRIRLSMEEALSLLTATLNAKPEHARWTDPSGTTLHPSGGVELEASVTVLTKALRLIEPSE